MTVFGEFVFNIFCIFSVFGSFFFFRCDKRGGGVPDFKEVFDLYDLESCSVKETQELNQKVSSAKVLGPVPFLIFISSAPDTESQGLLVEISLYEMGRPFTNTLHHQWPSL